jgi:hypothetical protein
MLQGFFMVTYCHPLDGNYMVQLGANIKKKEKKSKTGHIFPVFEWSDIRMPGTS